MEPVTREFNPGIDHPFYFIRRGLLNALKKHAFHLTGRLMDFGCGSKPYRNLFNVPEYVGVDFQNEGHSHELETIDVYYDGKSLPFSDNYFDSVLSSEVFEHIFNLPDILSEINRVMKPGGKILITCPFMWNEHEVPYDYARYTQFALKDLLTRHNFHVIELDKSGNFTTTIFQAWSLYWHTLLSTQAAKNSLVRWFYKYLLVAPGNLMGLFTNWLLPSNLSLYLSNIVVAEKRS